MSPGGCRRSQADRHRAPYGALWYPASRPADAGFTTPRCLTAPRYPIHASAHEPVGQEKRMLTREENELLTRIGPGTPMGEMLRRYWVPACPSAEVPERDCDPVRVRLLGEDL